MKIVFCHNVYNRYNMLLKTIGLEKEFYPDSHSIVAYNDAPPPEGMKMFENVEFHYFRGITHKIGCTNGFIVSVREALKHNPDVVVFSHDDVFIHRQFQTIFNKRIESIAKGEYDIICRMPGNGLYGNNYYLMECVFMSGKAAKQCFENMILYNNENEIARDLRGSLSPEVFLFNSLQHNNLKKQIFEYEHQLEGYNDTLQNLMGVHHLNAGKRGWV